MITRLDHVMIAVRDLDTAIDHYQRLGFRVISGGNHTTLGTQNAFIHFGFTYIELISTFDPARTIQALPHVDVMLNALDQRDGAMIGYALASTDLAKDMEHLSRTGLVVNQPYSVQRMRADGTALNVQVFMPGGQPWRRAWPFLYEWEWSNDEINRAQTHDNGITGIVKVSVGVKDFEQVITIYQQNLGLKLQKQDIVAHLDAKRATFCINDAFIDLLTPRGTGQLKKDLREIGEGVFEIFLTSNNLNHTRIYLEKQGIHFAQDSSDPHALVIEPQEMFETRWIITPETRHI
ncbi:VOC family protein [Dictyobacter arantiisoli]|uniref:Glyoxalase-like domain-containing protein n=1 Tax=Dictyobacter arantiisoli TaxID=2014874 RepID=A0A5A5TH15_9CHLR|nr:VOC family protein [Dictyobacter arantiisoli]GCF10254.1 hypothetical protein KDI_38180 [Dictyobacter arantiisoli]